MVLLDLEYAVADFNNSDRPKGVGFALQDLGATLQKVIAVGRVAQLGVIALRRALLFSECLTAAALPRRPQRVLPCRLGRTDTIWMNPTPVALDDFAHEPDTIVESET